MTHGKVKVFTVGFPVTVWNAEHNVEKMYLS